VLLCAIAEDTDGGVAEVQFYADDRLLGTVREGSLPTRMGRCCAGTYTLQARALDSFGGAATSAPARIHINGPPAVEITWPAAGNVVGWGDPWFGRGPSHHRDWPMRVRLAPVPFTASALRTDGTLTGWGENSHANSHFRPGSTGSAPLRLPVMPHSQLTVDGTLLGWGQTWSGQPADPPNARGAGCGHQRRTGSFSGRSARRRGCRLG